MTKNVCQLQAEKKFAKGTLRFVVTLLHWIHWMELAILWDEKM
jgi:hypothetical protein